MPSTWGRNLSHRAPGLWGSDDAENAAPLCPSCHETYGANPEKRKIIREARDHWFDICDNRYAPDSDGIGELTKRLESVATKADVESLVSTINSHGDAGLNGEEVLPERLKGRGISHDSVREYLRFMYPTVPHCGPDDCASLASDLDEVGYGTIDDLHDVLDVTRTSFAEYALSQRDSGATMDAVKDAFPARLFLGIWDEAYCQKHHPSLNLSEKYPGHHWRRPISDRGHP